MAEWWTLHALRCLLRKPSELGDELNLIPHHREATLHKTSFYLYTPVSHD
jgi:hypothetical protein